MERYKDGDVVNNQQKSGTLHYKNCFKIRVDYKNYKETLGVIREVYGGAIETDARLKPDEYWLHTNADKVTLKDSILIELIE